LGLLETVLIVELITRVANIKGYDKEPHGDDNRNPPPSTDMPNAYQPSYQCFRQFLNFSTNQYTQKLKSIITNKPIKINPPKTLSLI
jgi:hypothetical protein